MSDSIRLNDTVGCSVSRNRLSADTLKVMLEGTWKAELIRAGKVIWSEEGKNTITTQGKDKLLDCMFNGATQYSNWYMGLINNSPAPSIAATNTYVGIGGAQWTEWASYDEATRPEWAAGSSSAGVVTNAAPVTFTISASGVVKGIFVAAGANATTKSDNTAGNYLWCATAFAATVTVADDDQLKVTYTVSS